MDTPEHESRSRGLYDHETEDPRTGRRRRQVADWGVGEDAFDRMPSRRFSHADGPHARRAFSEPAPTSRTIVIQRSDPSADEAGERRTATDRRSAPERRAERRMAPERRMATDRRSAAERRAAFAAPPPAPAPAPPPAAADVAAAAPDPRPAPADGGRRTIVIGARTNQQLAVVPYRRRPPRTAVERLGHRPDRIVGYAVALGFLLIVIAILTAG